MHYESLYRRIRVYIIAYLHANRLEWMQTVDASNADGVIHGRTDGHPTDVVCYIKVNARIISV